MQKMNWWRKILYVIAIGTVCFFLSEGFFWARWRLDFNLMPSLQTWFVYCLVTYTTLVIIDQFKVHDFWGVFLAGAIYGWLLEAVIVGTFYEDFPLGISFTGLGWHALISICVGMYALPRLLRRAKAGKVALYSAIAGVLYASWAIWWWLEEGEVPNAFIPWSIYTLGLAIFCLIALWGADRLSRKFAFTTAPKEMTILLSVWSAFFVFTRFFTYWWGLLVLPPLMLVTFFALRKGKMTMTRQATPVLQTIRGDVPLENLFLLLLMPVTAMIFYGIAYGLGVMFPTNIFFYTVLMPAGFVLYILALVKMFRRKGTIEDAKTHNATGAQHG